MTDKLPAERFPPGHFIKEEMEARRWTQGDLADITGIDRAGLNLVINGKRQITPETAAAIGEAFGTGAKLWLNLESSYRLWKQRPDVSDVARRAKLWEKAPMKEILRRGWIERSENVEVLERRVRAFFEIASLDEEPRIYQAARKSTDYEAPTPAQFAWLFRAKHLCRALQVKPFSDSSLAAALKKLPSLRKNAEDVRKVPVVLADAGIRLVALEQIAGTRIDGACFWLSKNEPVIALSLRYDRIDCFWHTLVHELRHVMNRDGLRQHLSVDIRLVGSDALRPAEKPQHERDVDDFASSFLVERAALEDFIARTHPLYSKVKIAKFASRIEVHPGIVVGQLQFRNEIPYSHSREMLVPVKEILASSALTEGWGNIVAQAL
jgi:HTH-type transcriptional regulator/antitoxin HigA